MLTPALLRSIRLTAEMRSQPVTAGGVRTAPVHLFDLLVAPIDAVTPEVLIGFALQTPFQAKQTFAYTKDAIQVGMHLFFNDTQYPVKGVAAYPEDDGYTLYHLILENIVQQ